MSSDRLSACALSGWGNLGGLRCRLAVQQKNCNKADFISESTKTSYFQLWHLILVAGALDNSNALKLFHSRCSRFFHFPCTELGMILRTLQCDLQLCLFFLILPSFAHCIHSSAEKLEGGFMVSDHFIKRMMWLALAQCIWPGPGHDKLSFIPPRSLSLLSRPTSYCRAAIVPSPLVPWDRSILICVYFCYVADSEKKRGRDCKSLLLLLFLFSCLLLLPFSSQLSHRPRPFSSVSRLWRV